jgi:hypothetical protein
MKPTDKPEISVKWWSRKKPEDIEGKQLETALSRAEDAYVAAKSKIDKEVADYDSIRKAQNALSGFRFAVEKTIKKECEKSKHKDVITVLEKFDDVIRNAELILRDAKEKLDESPEAEGSEEQQKRKAKKFDASKPRVYFSSRFLKNHVHVGNESVEKRAEVVFQRRDESTSTVIGLEPKKLNELASEIFDRQDEFAKAPKKVYITNDKHQLWSRGGNSDKERKRATSTNSTFKFKVKKNSDGFFVMDHFDGY